MSLEPFLVDYGLEGMYARHLGDPELVNEMEVLGVGMEVEGEWAQGGPLVWRRANGAHVIGWIRALAKSDVGRAGAVRAWGVQARDEERIVHWPWYWEKLKDDPTLDIQRLHDLVAALSARVIKPTLPRLDDDFVGLLSEAYRRYARGETGTLYIPLQSKGELPVLAWFWLLGPTQPRWATLGPPRREPPAVAAEFTYAGQLDAPKQQFKPSQAITTRLLQPIKVGTYQNAVLAAKALREMGAQELLQLLDPQPPRSRMSKISGDEMKESEEGSTAPPTDSGSPRAFNVAGLRAWGSLGVGLVNTSLLVLIFLMLWKSSSAGDKSSFDPKTATAAMGTSTTTTSGESTVTTTESAGVVTTTDALRPEVIGVALHSELRKRKPGTTYGATLGTWIDDVTPSMTRNDIARARTAAVQIYFQKNACGTGPIDGGIGPAFWDSVHCLARKNDSLDVMKSDQKLIDWLQRNL